ncbi:MAG TPA: quinone-dependent dihydroorotate dehydrogenase [Deltaproteobacteria bacterium]|nr:quinone-dependent dihydroorotate dehydrogenase [Deltaproteobacteria bacterium]
MLELIWPLIRALLFRLEAERAHGLTLSLLEHLGAPLGALARLDLPLTSGPPVQLGPLTLPSPIGLAAGLDKDGVALPFWPSLGFGFVELGTVTAHPQPGNPRPRLFRLPTDRALINRMGFNNQGSAALAQRLRALRRRGGWPDVPVGANIGKSKRTPLEEATGDYVTSVRRLVGLVDWFTVNVSSPNTEGLRSLQDRDALARLLPAVLAAASGTPVLLKLAPDLSDAAIDEAVGLAQELGVTGIVATNTTITRPGLGHDPDQDGGLSGRPLWPLARDRIQRILDVAGDLPVVGVGGISTPEQVCELLEAGCVAIQLYTALIYEGPALPARLHRAVSLAHNTGSAPPPPRRAG